MRLLSTLRHWMAALGKWSRRTCRSQNHMADHITTLAARLICGVTATGRKLLAGLGQEKAARLKDITIPIIRGAWDQQRVDVTEAVKYIDALRNDALARAKERRRKDFDDWVADALGGTAKEAYRWVSLDSKSPPADLILTKNDGDGMRIISDPDEVANLHADPWHDRWECDRAVDGVDELSLIGNRRAALLDAAHDYATRLDLTPRAIRMACNSFHKATAIGVDDLDFHTIATLPDAALSMLGDLIRACVAHTALPHGALLVILNLLGKKGGGVRTIATMATLYRLIMRLCGDDIGDWDAAKAGFFDTAVAGNSALRAHLLRSLEVELATVEGQFTAHVLWDMEKFFDSIKIGVLIPRLDALGYPSAVATLGLVAHRAPRVLRTGNSISRPLCNAGRSIVAGCQQSVSWARALLLRFVEGLGYVVPGSICFEHVDDLSQVVAQRSGALLHRAVVDIGLAVKKGVEELDLRLSAKSLVLPKSDPYVARAARDLQRRGVRITAAASGEDLGVQTTAGKVRRTSTLAKRVASTALRAKRIHRLAKSTRTATKLARPSMASRQTYGHQAFGVSPTLMSAIRGNLRAASHLGNTRGCTTSILWWTYGPGADPAIQVPLEQLAAWIDFWQSADTPTRRRVRLAWKVVMPRLMAAQHKWPQVKGFMSATIVTVANLGWRPASPSHWRVDGDTMATLDEVKYAKVHILEKGIYYIDRQVGGEGRVPPAWERHWV